MYVVCVIFSSQLYVQYHTLVLMFMITPWQLYLKHLHQMSKSAIISIQHSVALCVENIALPKLCYLSTLPHCYAHAIWKEATFLHYFFPCCTASSA